MRQSRTLAFLALSMAMGLAAQEQDLTSLSLEDFLKVEVVSVRKSQQKLSRTPAAVYVITQADIRRSGAASLPEALRMAPGIHVARLNGSVWAVGMRGFNNFTSNQLLVMIDGRTIYNPIMSGVIWSHQMIMLEDVERIEVIRGPAGAVWGANAVSGVINVITRKASATQGALVAASGGSMDPARASVRYGAKRGERLAWRTWLHQERNGQATTAGAARLGAWNTGRAGARFDWFREESDEVTVQTEVAALQADVNVVRYPRPMSIEIAKARAGGWAGFLMAQWTHTNRRGDQSKLQVFEDLQNMDTGIIPLGVRTFDIDLQHSISLPRGHNLLVGGGFRASHVSTAGNRNLSFQPAERTYSISNIFVQDEWQISPDRLVLTLGGKVERYTLARPAFQPSARLMWTPTRRQAYWAAVSGAVRVPSHADYALRYPLGEAEGALLPVALLISGSEQAQPERLRAIEAGFRWQLWKRAALELSAFRNSFQGLHAYQTPFALTPQNFGAALRQGATSIPATQINGSDAVTGGGEISVHYDVTGSWRLLGSYSTALQTSRLRPSFNPETILPVTQYYPAHMAQFRSSWDLGRRWMVDAEVYRTGALKHNGEDSMPGRTRADIRLERKLGERSGIYVNGQNLLHRSQAEFVGNLFFPAGSVGRSISVGLRWEQ
ncbi:MAG: TonB-dependent receptor [Acidobacteriia bacterium]|nr:TonB-dependent receptor [Terriglobia bacterium]